MDYSFGIIPLRQSQNGWEVFLILHLGGKHWGFPKGHAEALETAEETAKREFSEETGMQVVKLLKNEPFKESYEFYARGTKIHKTVHYFLAEVKGEPVLQLQEVEDCKWVPLEEACNHLTFPQAKNLSKKAMHFLNAQ